MAAGCWRTPAAIIGVPADATQAERGAMLTAAADAGLGPITLLTEPLAAAIGAGLAVDEPAGSMIVECGAGTTEVAVFSLGGICGTGSVRIGGDTLNRALADQVHLQHKFLIGDRSAEQLKLQYKRAKEIGATSRAIDREIKLKELQLDQFGDSFVWQTCSFLRAPHDFAAAKLLTLKREELAQSMLVWTKSPIPTSLIRFDVAEHAKDDLELGVVGRGGVREGAVLGERVLGERA